MHFPITLSLILYFFTFGMGNKNTPAVVQQSVSQDTLSKISLRNKIYGKVKYTVMLLEELETNVDLLTTRKKITLNKNGKTVDTISLPIANAEAKNFLVIRISETKQGFKISVNWGGGNYIYDIDYYFVYRNQQFNFSALTSYMYGASSSVKKVAKVIRPLVPISKFDVITYLNNH